jgi:hypothetical protein
LLFTSVAQTFGRILESKMAYDKCADTEKT